MQWSNADLAWRWLARVYQVRYAISGADSYRILHSVAKRIVCLLFSLFLNYHGATEETKAATNLGLADQRMHLERPPKHLSET